MRSAAVANRWALRPVHPPSYCDRINPAFSTLRLKVKEVAIKETLPRTLPAVSHVPST